MKREIKFRAWDGIRMTSSGIMFNCTNYCLEVPQWSAMKLMQYTGLKDKNGKEIYEGDIVSSSIFGQGIVFWHLDGWHLGNPDDINHSDCLSTFPALEIIGNIYENPELLTH